MAQIGKLHQYMIVEARTNIIGMDWLSKVVSVGMNTEMVSSYSYFYFSSSSILATCWSTTCIFIDKIVVALKSYLDLIKNNQQLVSNKKHSARKRFGYIKCIMWLCLQLQVLAQVLVWARMTLIWLNMQWQWIAFHLYILFQSYRGVEIPRL